MFIRFAIYANVSKLGRSPTLRVFLNHGIGSFPRGKQPKLCVYVISDGGLVLYLCNCSHSLHGITVEKRLGIYSWMLTSVIFGTRSQKNCLWIFEILQLKTKRIRTNSKENKWNWKQIKTEVKKQIQVKSKTNIEMFHQSSAWPFWKLPLYELSFFFAKLWPCLFRRCDRILHALYVSRLQNSNLTVI